MQIVVGIIMFLLIVGALGCFVAVIVVAARSSSDRISLKHLPALLPVATMNKREIKMMDDLTVVAQKTGLRLLAKTPLSAVVETEWESSRQKWRGKLGVWQVDFLLLDPDTLKPVLAVLPAEAGAGQEQRHQICVAVLTAAKIPYILLGNYNLIGLEKAVKTKIEDAAAAKHH